VEKTREATGVNEKKYDLEDMNRFKNNLVEFTYFTKKVLPALKTIKK